MTNSEEEQTPGIDDDQLPEDLVPSDDNPLAEGLGDGETVGELLEDGKPAEESEDTEKAGAANADADTPDGPAEG